MEGHKGGRRRAQNEVSQMAAHQRVRGGAGGGRPRERGRGGEGAGGAARSSPPAPRRRLHGRDFASKSEQPSRHMVSRSSVESADHAPQSSRPLAAVLRAAAATTAAAAAVPTSSPLTLHGAAQRVGERRVARKLEPEPRPAAQYLVDLRDDTRRRARERKRAREREQAESESAEGKRDDDATDRRRDPLLRQVPHTTTARAGPVC